MSPLQRLQTLRVDIGQGPERATRGGETDGQRSANPPAAEGQVQPAEHGSLEREEPGQDAQFGQREEGQGTRQIKRAARKRPHQKPLTPVYHIPRREED